jgi:hypothetical protein
MSVSYPKILLTIGLIAALFFSMVAGTQVFAAPATVVMRDALSAQALWFGPVGQFSNIRLSVYKSDVETLAFLSLDTPTTQGYLALFRTTANVNVFQATNGLTSATLSPITFRLFNCQNVPVTIQATWTGLVSPTTSTIVNIIGGTGGHITIKSTGTFKFGTATGTLNGENLGQSSSTYTYVGRMREVQITTSGFVGGP